MGNKKKTGRPVKRKFFGNKFVQLTKFLDENETPVVDSDAMKPTCSSAKKIKVHESEGQAEKDNKGNGFILMDIKLLFEFLCTNFKCDKCCQYSLTCELVEQTRNGFCHEIEIKCLYCGEWNTNFSTSDESSSATHKHKEVNVRMVAFVRSIGRGHSALQNFSMYMNTSQPMARRAYKRTLHRIHSASKDIAMDSMNAAAKEVRELKTSGMVNDRPTESDVADCAVSLDGTWQRRGHASHHGVVTAISVDTGKCVDAEVLSNICKGCQHWEEKKASVDYEKWKLTHNCKINHTGSAGAMEAVGAVRIFSRSEQMRKLKYTQYLGDGDSASFKKVLEAKPYGDVEVEKLECVGHVQKRCGTRLRKLKKENKGIKLDDGKGLEGVGRLTDKKIDTLQNYYGFAIRQNQGNLENMVRDVMAVLPHVGSSEVNPNHDGCPIDSWCKYKVNPGKYTHKNGLPQAVMDFIQPVFNDLAKEDLLRKCLHGKTQNNNEALNKLIWERCTKEVYVERETIEEAVFSAISYFNDGAVSIVHLFERLGFFGYHTKKLSTKRDMLRISGSVKKSQEKTKRRRKTLRALNKGFKDTATAVEGDLYSTGAH